MKFLHALFVGIIYKVVLTVIEIICGKKSLMIETRIFDKVTNVVVIIGFALVQNPNLKLEE